MKPLSSPAADIDDLISILKHVSEHEAVTPARQGRKKIAQRFYRWVPGGRGTSPVRDERTRGQTEHHRKMTFKEEIEVFLKKHGMEYVERDLE